MPSMARKQMSCDNNSIKMTKSNGALKIQYGSPNDSSTPVVNFGQIAFLTGKNQILEAKCQHLHFYSVNSLQGHRMPVFTDHQFTLAITYCLRNSGDKVLTLISAETLKGFEAS